MKLTKTAVLPAFIAASLTLLTALNPEDAKACVDCPDTLPNLKPVPAYEHQAPYATPIIYDQNQTTPSGEAVTDPRCEHSDGYVYTDDGAGVLVCNRRGEPFGDTAILPDAYIMEQVRSLRDKDLAMALMKENCLGIYSNRAGCSPVAVTPGLGFDNINIGELLNKLLANMQSAASIPEQTQVITDSYVHPIPRFDNMLSLVILKENGTFAEIEIPGCANVPFYPQQPQFCDLHFSMRGPSVCYLK